MIPLLIEPAYGHTHWAQMYMTGIREEAQRRGREAKTIAPGDLKNDPVIVLGSTISWLKPCFRSLARRGIPAVLAGAPPVDVLCSFSAPDYEGAIAQFFQSAAAIRGEKCALFASHPASSADSMKRQAFERICAGGVIVENEGDLLASAQRFCRRMEGIAAVLCVNDVAAMILRRTLAKQKNEMILLTFGDQPLPEEERIRVFRMDMVEAGRQAVHLVRSLEKQPNIRRCAWIPCGLEDGLFSERPAHAEEAPPRTAMDFYQDPEVPEVFRFKALLRAMDSLDLDILRELLAYSRYADMAESLHTTEQTIKYRVKRMMQHAGVPSRDALLRLAKDYFAWPE